MPGLVPGIHDLGLCRITDVDGRDKPGHNPAVSQFPPPTVLFSTNKSLLRQGEADVQLAQLARRDLGWCAHQKILGLLIHRKQHHLAQVLLAA